MKIKDGIVQYQECYEFQKLAHSTQTDYRYYLSIINKKFGNINILKLGERALIFDFRSFNSQFVSNTPRKAKYILDVFRIFVKWCFINGYIRKNPLNMLFMKINNKPKIDNIWSENDVKYVMSNAPQPLQDFIFVALETGLRRCDLIRLTFDHIHIIENRYVFKINMQKTNKPIILPLSKNLTLWLEKLDYSSGFILKSTNGEPWHKDKFSHAWQRMKKRLKFKNITPHGLRKTAVTRLARTGCNVLEISALLGWSLKSVQNMLDKHYFKDKVSVAFNAIDKLDNYRKAAISS